MALRTFHTVIDDNHTMTVVTIIARWTYFAGRLSHLILIPATWAKHWD